MTFSGKIRPRPLWTAVLAGSALVVFAMTLLTPFALYQRVDNRIEQWVKPDSGEAARYKRFQRLFGSDEYVIVAYEGRDLFAPDALRTQVTALDRLESIRGVISAFGIPAVYRDTFGMEDPEALREEIDSTPFYRDFVVSDDGTMAGLVMETRPPADIDGRKRLMADIGDAVQPLRRDGWQVHIAGPPALNVALDAASQRESLRLLPIALAVSSVVLLLLLGSLRVLVVAIVCASATVLITIGAMAAVHRPLNMVTSSMPALVWVLSLSNVVHLLKAYFKQTASEIQIRIAKAIGVTWRPCLMSSVTTAFGFFSLAVAPMRAVVDFGLFAGLGLLFSFVVAFSLGSALLWLLRPRRSVALVDGLFKTSIRSLVHAAMARREIAFFVGAAVILATPFAIAHLRMESNPLDFLSPESAVAKAYRTVAKRLTGLYSLEIMIDTPDGWLKQDTTAEIAQLASDIQSLPGVARVLTPTDYLRKLNQWDHDFDPAMYRLPVSRAKAELLLNEAGEEGQLRRFATTDGSAVRLSVLVNKMNSASFLGLADSIQERLARSSLHTETTGVILQLVRAQNALVTTQALSLLAAYLLIFPCMFIGLRSLRLAALSVVPNTLPILAGFCLMAPLRIPLDAATIMMAGIALGIAVDDTIHVMWAWQRRRIAGVAPGAAALGAIEEVDVAIATTTLTALSGFLVLLASEFTPLRYFGLIAGFTLGVAFLADIAILPPLLALSGARVHRANHERDCSYPEKDACVAVEGR